MASSKQLVFPIIRAHSVQPNRTRELGITLVTPGLLRIRSNKPPYYVSTDRYKAFRRAGHIDDTYLDELNINAQVLKKVNSKNDLVAKNLHDIETVRQTHTNLKVLLDSLRFIRAPTKRLAIEKLKNAVEMLPQLNESTNPLGIERIGDIVYGEISKFSELYGKWRANEISSTREAVSRREPVLIELRREYLRSVVQLWADVLSNGNNVIMRSLWKRDVDIRTDLLTVFNRDLDMDGLITQGMSLRDVYNVSHLRSAYTLFKAGRVEEGKSHFREFALALGTRNPFSVIPEVREDIELAAAIMLEDGLTAIKGGRFNRAKKEFESILRLPETNL
ncbi:MAG: hypothetical protein V1492_05270 [Candidatus Micrarchaeota archaeon]